MTSRSRPPKSAMLVAERIVQDALREGIGPGDALPLEKSMLLRYEIGRGTLREALRLLEFQGVILLKPGMHGGPVMQDPDASHLGSTLALLMQLKSAPLRTIAEVRTALEPMICRLAAERMSAQSLDELHGTIDRMRTDIDDERIFLEANKRFHEIIAWSSGNTLFGYLVASLFRIMDSAVTGIDYPWHRRTAVVHAHEQIYDALRSHDPQMSEVRMREHIADYDRFTEQKYPEVLKQTIRWRHPM